MPTATDTLAGPEPPTICQDEPSHEHTETTEKKESAAMSEEEIRIKRIQETVETQMKACLGLEVP